MTDGTNKVNYTKILRKPENITYKPKITAPQTKLTSKDVFVDPHFCDLLGLSFEELEHVRPLNRSPEKGRVGCLTDSKLFKNARAFKFLIPITTLFAE